jgi:membrane protease YdiL (CAAX protease family)
MISIRFVAIFYTLMGGLGWALATYWLDLDPFVWKGIEIEPTRDAAVGVVVGLVTVVTSNLLERWAEWARRLSAAFRDTLGEMKLPQILALAVFSSVGEELLFRGFLQQGISEHLLSGEFARPGGLVLSSLIFGALHVGPDWKTFWPWTVMAIVMGGAFGLMFQLTGNLLAPILAHFTINFLNLIAIMNNKPSEDSE